MFNVKSTYSFNQATILVKDYVQQAKAMGYQAVGLADQGNLFAAYEFYQASQVFGIKAVLGLTVSLPGLIDDQKAWPALIYAIDQKGYQGLIKLSRLMSHQKEYSNQLYLNCLSDYKGHLVYISRGHDSELDSLVLHDQIKEAQDLLKQLREIFGEDKVYLGHQILPFNQIVTRHLSDFAKSMDLKQVSTQPVRLLQQEDVMALTILKRRVDRAAYEPLDLTNFGQRSEKVLLSRKDLEDLYQHYGLVEIISNSDQLMTRLEFKLQEGKDLLPVFDSGSLLTSQEYLKQLVTQALNQFGLAAKNTYQERLAYELSVIHQMGYDDYFLIVADIVSYCRQHHIQLGAGRGSAPGSLVTYLLGVSTIDPLKYDLIFERFLNPERQTMPDIDLDIPNSHRDQVIAYVRQKYGYEQVAQIATFNRFGAKSAIQEVLRQVGQDSQLKTWSKLIPTDPNRKIDLGQAYQENKSFRHLVDASPTNQAIFQAGQALEGLISEHSIHAGGLVITDFPIDSMIPVLEEGQSLITQFDKDGVENLGLLKIDLLALKNLTLLDQILQEVKVKDQAFEIEDIDLNDHETLQLFRRAQTRGVFQFESPGIRNVLSQLQPTSFEDIVAVNALFRPGPMGQIQTYIKRKHGQYQATYPVPELEGILKDTYGIIIYQEQVMQILVSMAGFTMGQADLLRRAMSKKDHEVMQAQKVNFLTGALEKGYEEKTASQVYDAIAEFANYGFNRSHAVVYSKLAFQLAYLKVHYSQAFFLGQLKFDPTQMQAYLEEIKAAGIKILTLDVNKSQMGVSANGNDLRLGFQMVKGIRPDLMREIIDNRQLMGPYQDFFDFLRRLPDKYLQVTPLEILIKVGAFDSLGYNRATLLTNLEKVIESVRFSGLNMDLFEEMAPKIETVAELNPLQLIHQEKEHLGFYLSGHPLDFYRDNLNAEINLMNISQIKKEEPKSPFRLLGIISRIKLTQTRQGQTMAFAQIEDESGKLDQVLFPKVFERYHSLLKEEGILLVTGSYGQSKRGQAQIIINRLELPDKLISDKGSQNNYKICFIKLAKNNLINNNIEWLKKLSISNPGPCQVILVVGQDKPFALNDTYNISYSQRVQTYLRNRFGAANVVYR
ncbi:DNA polymerase III subunit alpha [Eremococcus coleocola]|uniref:DNA polymerase III subunit alpha n=1 Tax=Eremococcus coleocola ACS-139-V-Col8 TaxID=908337 RepID=E4KLW9_9LACT|nr:DNA polymerase III subunit alpha [Eremococcus coleocola]EFR31960.1 DNA polymerase III, alpha subunit [Eremococcus coleocola ACS-139-V-Col8]